MGLEKLTQWSGPTTPLRAAPGQYAGADQRAEGVDMELHHESAIHAGDEPVSEAASSCEHLLASGQNPDDDMRRPGERLHVYRSAGGWTGKKGDQRLTVHGFRSEAAFSQGEIVLTTSSLAKEAAALSLMRSDPRDVRPLLLLMFYAQDRTHVLPVLRYGIGYLQAWVHRIGALPKTGSARKAEAIRWAAADALAELYRARISPDRGRGEDHADWVRPATALPAAFRLAHASDVRAGYNAFTSGEACPHVAGSSREVAWVYGWEWACRRDEPATKAASERRCRRGTAPLAALSADARAASIGVRESSFAMLRRKALCVYEMRLNEAKADFRGGVVRQREVANYVAKAIDGRPSATTTGQSDGDGMDRQKLSSWWSVREALLAKRAPVRIVLGNVAVSTPAKR